VALGIDSEETVDLIEGDGLGGATWSAATLGPVVQAPSEKVTTSAPPVLKKSRRVR